MLSLLFLEEIVGLRCSTMDFDREVLGEGSPPKTLPRLCEGLELEEGDFSPLLVPTVEDAAVLIVDLEETLLESLLDSLDIICEGAVTKTDGLR
mmetsp:Transcript_13078/g.31810  ORF Transcript_13078/g.31810 Transcript_13078/m.31810 type:complete len:94 (-) Transcript_13078:248-529(-)